MDKVSWDIFVSSYMIRKNHFKGIQKQLTDGNTEQSSPGLLRGGENRESKLMIFVTSSAAGSFELGQPTFLVLPTFPSCVPVLLFVGINYEVIWVNYLKFLCNYVIMIYCCPHLTS